MKRWAQKYDVHVWLVAHPKQLQDWDGEAPTFYDISGSAHWYNKADMGVVIHRRGGRHTHTHTHTGNAQARAAAQCGAPPPGV